MRWVVGEFIEGILHESASVFEKNANINFFFRFFLQKKHDSIFTFFDD
jgi:hypothetical protein